MKQKHIDFIICKDGNRIVKMRFYPLTSHCHGFQDDPPINWDEVYKVYYHWSILESFKGFENNDWEPFVPVFEMGRDECSALTYLADAIEWVVKKKKKFLSVETIGQPGSIWELKYKKAFEWVEKKDSWGFDRKRTPQKDWLEISVFDNYTSKGYRFNIDVKNIKSFTLYLNNVNKHMLDNGEPC